MLFIFLSYYPLKQGLKPRTGDLNYALLHRIFILLSIKTRIETCNQLPNIHYLQGFLSYYPLKQGLKPHLNCLDKKDMSIFILLSIKTRIETNIPYPKTSFLHRFLSYYPLKQGLKRPNIFSNARTSALFLSYYPLKQGLKQ